MKYVTNRTATVILLAFAFGAVVAVLKGGSDGIRDSIGNLSAPWLLLPYFAGTTARGWIRGAVVGTVACLTALGAFYIAQAFVLDLGGHPMLTNLELTLSAGSRYFAAGILSGPVLGAIGVLRTRCSPVITAAVVGLTLVGEPLAVFIWLAHEGITSSSSGMVTHYPVLWIGEMVLGLILAIGMFTWTLPGVAQRHIVRSRR